MSVTEVMEGADLTWLTKDHQEVQITDEAHRLNAVHVFDDESRDAVNTSLAAVRPLLIRGEPGLGKTQLALAAAKALKRQPVTFTVTGNTEGQDLLWQFDAVGRLAEAQIHGSKDEAQVRQMLAVKRFIMPGPLWSAYHWKSANDHLSTLGLAPKKKKDWVDEDAGCVLLIDEIDKAESDLPNHLLEALGSGHFRPKGFDEDIEFQTPTPLVIITTNQDRVLPHAFLRRCVVLDMKFPSRDVLLTRAAAHFPESTESIRELALDLLMKQRSLNDAPPMPGQAEFLDIIRAVMSMHQDNDEREATMKNIAKFIFNKYSG